MNEWTCPFAAAVTLQHDLLKRQSSSQRALIQILEDRIAETPIVKPSHSNSKGFLESREEMESRRPLYCLAFTKHLPLGAGCSIKCFICITSYTSEVVIITGESRGGD